MGFWQGAFRDPASHTSPPPATPSPARQPITVELLYG